METYFNIVFGPLLSFVASHFFIKTLLQCELTDVFLFWIASGFLEDL